jgi:hypothetical protein
VLRYHGVIAEGGTGAEKRPKGGSTFNRAGRWALVGNGGARAKVQSQGSSTLANKVGVGGIADSRRLN